MPLRASLLACALLTLGCASPDTGAQTPDDAMPIDSAYVAGTLGGGDDLIASRAVTAEGSALWDTVTTAAWMRLAQTSPEEQRAADEAVASGAFLGDPVPVLRLQPGDEPGTARLETLDPLGTPFETEALVRVAQGGGVLDLVFTGEAGGGRRMPSLLQVSFALTAGDSRGVSVAVGDGQGEPSELARADLPADLNLDRYAHRLGVRYAPGRVMVLLDGAVVLEAEARIGGGPMRALAVGTTQGETAATLLAWTLTTAP